MKKKPRCEVCRRSLPLNRYGVCPVCVERFMAAAEREIERTAR